VRWRARVNWTTLAFSLHSLCSEQVSTSTSQLCSMARKRKRTKGEDTTSKKSFGFPYAPSIIETMIDSSSKRAPEVQEPEVSQSDTEDGVSSIDCGISEPGEEAAVSGDGPIVVPTPDLTDKSAINYIVTRGTSNAPTSVLIFSDSSRSLYISGMCEVMLLYGKANINGYKLKSSEAVEIMCPSWTPACRMFMDTRNSDSSVRQQTFISQLLSKHRHLESCKASLLSCIDSSMTVLQVSAFNTSTMDWLIRCEDYSKYTVPKDELKSDSTSSSTQCGAIIHLSSAVVGDTASIVQSGLEYTILPPDWVDGVDTVCKNIKICPRTMVCGAKGVGKSTCLRYSINRLLSKTPVVAVIDCDIGQPELTPSGLVSLHIISEPLLSPPHLHLRTPELSFYLGDNTTKRFPHLFEACVRKLYDKYISLRDGYSCSGRVEAAGGKSTSGGFGALDDTPYERFSLPLVVNTDGWIRGMGSDILLSVTDIVSPTHVLHISTNKDRTLPAIEKLQQQNAVAHEKGSIENNVTISKLTPGRATASRIAAQDLRDLRLMSYFLRQSPELNVTSEPLSVWIKSGALTDPEGAVASALLHSLEFSQPIKRLCLHTIGTMVSPRLLLAAFNAALVGVTPSSMLHDYDTSLHDSTCSTVKLKISRDSSASQSTGPSLGEPIFDRYSLDFLMDSDVPIPCAALGIVSDVDLLNSCVHLITPLSEQELYSDSQQSGVSTKLHLIRGNMQLPTSLLYTGPSAVCTPYLCSESFGEGSGKNSGSRTNLKRRSQQNK